MPKTITLAITGASGAQYGVRLLELLLAANCRVNLLISNAAEVVIRKELGWELPVEFAQKVLWWHQKFQVDSGQLAIFDRDDWFSPAASGSAPISAMVICPASGGTLSALASGASNNLIERAGDVMIKERRQLIVVPREMPYSQIHLENMLKLTQMGVVIMPASPGFYHNPKTLDDLIDFVVARILDHLHVEQVIMPTWGSTPN